MPAFLWILIQYGATPRTIAISIACTLLALAALIDNDTGFLPDTLTIPLIGLGLLLSWAQWIPISLYSATIGACLTYAAMWLLNVFYRELRGLDGMGGGDAKLASGIGAWLGLPDVLWVLSLACLLGIIVAAVSSGRYNGKQSLRFGPYLAASAIVWMVGG
ncbi:A24 family peptidase [Paenalcaligenes niemegkensis]|uniref:prepilin peptidase n=1 Tax=Paenalcaligenes niemegkensis TaxID=2895469 RepID=UPI001EE8DE7D|nr:A24 family peptidase [Paenalcaligenes niemegkensis]MCQ9617066.1 A24 family peptidase [Paenalcaligenes niemegkensis]